jgi:hypothetical protein
MMPLRDARPEKFPQMWEAPVWACSLRETLSARRFACIITLMKEVRSDGDMPEMRMCQ